MFVSDDASHLQKILEAESISVVNFSKKTYQNNKLGSGKIAGSVGGRYAIFVDDAIEAHARNF